MPILTPPPPRRASRGWRELIRKVYEVDPLTCPHKAFSKPAVAPSAVPRAYLNALRPHPVTISRIHMALTGSKSTENACVGSSQEKEIPTIM